MRLSIEHLTTFVFPVPRARVVQLLRMTPGNSDDQTVAAWHIAVDCDARMTTHRDGFGNITTMLYCDGLVDRIELLVTGEVVTSDAQGVVSGATETLPPQLFLRSTPATTPDAAIAAFARDTAGGRDLPALHRLNLAIRGRFADDIGRSDGDRITTEAFERESLSARDMAQLFVAAARTLGVPARFISGYCEMTAGTVPHCWAEVWTPDAGWTGFDPMQGRSPAEQHVRVAVGLDAAGATPIAGPRGAEPEVAEVIGHRLD